MKEEEFDLSNRIEPVHNWNNDEDFNAIPFTDIKEFISRRNRLDMLLYKHEITWGEYIERRNKLAGDKLKC